MFRARTLFSTAALALITAYGAAAQAGVADLRYVLPLPSSVVFTTTDTMETTITGMPTGDAKMTTTMRSVNELQFAPGDSGIAVTAALRSFSGVTATAMGDLAMKTAEVPPIRFHIGVKGNSPGKLVGDLGATSLSAGPEQNLTKSRALVGLVALPGRKVQIGEIWNDTMRTSRANEGMQVDMLTIVRGTYVADSVVSGRTLNVLRFLAETTTTMSGTQQGMDLTQTTTSRSEELVLWDSERHVPVFRDTMIHLDAETGLKQMNMTTRMRTTSRTITTGEAQN